MKAWLERIWSWVKADLSTTDELEEKEEREHREQQAQREQARLQRKRQNRLGDTDGFRVVR
jgi:hypothetical protein